MEQAIRIQAPGGPEVMRLEPMDLPEPGPGQVRVRHQVLPVNYVDIQQRAGHYPVPLPSGLGVEAVGLVEATGEGVTGYDPGTPVVYLTREPGAYATSGLCDARQAVRLPPGVPLDQAGALFLRAILAWHLTHSVYPVKEGDTLLVYAAAGVAGSLVARLARAAGCSVIGVIGGSEQAAIALAAGCEAVLDVADADLAGAVRSLTDGAGADVVYDSIGADTFTRSLDSLRPQGMLVAYGNASGIIPPFAPWQELGHRGSLKMAWPMLKDFMNQADMQRAIPPVLAGLSTGALTVEIGQRFPLAEAAEAHRLVESRLAVGATILVP